MIVDKRAHELENGAKPNPDSIPDGSGPGSGDSDTASGGSPDQPDH